MNWSLSCVIITDYRLWELGDSPHLFWRKNTHIILFFIFESEAGLLAFKEALVQSVFSNKLTLIIISIIIQPNKLQVCMRFWGNSDSEWVLFEWLDETGLKFWFQNTCEKVKSDFWNRNKNKIKKVPFFRDTLYLVGFVFHLILLVCLSYWYTHHKYYILQ